MAQPPSSHQSHPPTHSPPPSHPSSQTSSPVSKPSGSSTPLSLDLSSLPPLITPSPPSNTLLLTNLTNPSTFSAPSLQTIRTLLSQPTPLNSFSPLRSLRRIIISYPSTEAAIEMRKTLEQENIFVNNSIGGSEGDNKGEADQQLKIYFGDHTPVLGVDQDLDQHLHPPSLGKLLFISPPPSPPMGWEGREEDPPNRDVLGEDLQKALAGLTGASRTMDYAHDNSATEFNPTTIHSNTHNATADQTSDTEIQPPLQQQSRKRIATGSSLTVYHPRDHGGKDDLPKVMVEDTTDFDASADGNENGIGSGKRGVTMTHTARPPVELMEGM